MLDTHPTRPSTLAGIKRLAKRIKQERGLPHHEGLDLASQVGGYSNYPHAQRELGGAQASSSTPIPQGFPLYISVQWRDQKGNRGRETLFMSLSSSWEDLITRQQMEKLGKLRNLHSDGPYHLVRPPFSDSAELARQHAFQIGRVLQFIDATRLTPSSSHSRVYPGGSSSNAIPGKDHSSIWYHRPSGSYVFVDEPYEGAMSWHHDKRRQWADRHGYVIKMPAWRGMHHPLEHGTQLHLIASADNTELLDDLVRALDRLPRHLVDEVWNGESSQGLTPFVPPEAESDASKRLEKKTAKPARKRRIGQTVSFRSLGGSGRRPAQRMPLSGHREVGNLLQAVHREAYYRQGVVSAVGQVRNELDEWVQGEYTHEELPQNVFQELYYGGLPQKRATISRRPSLEQRQGWMADLERAKTVLAEHYPDCAPVSTLIKKLDRAKGSVEKWQPK